eukprot:jgi/Bigna1/130275/aug1.11_g4983
MVCDSHFDDHGHDGDGDGEAGDDEDHDSDHQHSDSEDGGDEDDHEARDCPDNIAEFHRDVLRAKMPRKDLRSMVLSFEEHIGPTLNNAECLPSSAHQAKRMIRVLDVVKEGKSLVNTEPKRLAVCQEGCVAFTGRLEDNRACPNCKSLKEKGVTLFVNDLGKRLRQNLSSNDSHPRGFDPNPPCAGKDGGVGTTSDSAVFRRVMRDARDWDQAIGLHNDGAAITTLNGQSFTPIAVVWHNLPPHLRWKRNFIFTHVMFAGHSNSLSGQARLTMTASELKVRISVSLRCQRGTWCNDFVCCLEAGSVAGGRSCERNDGQRQGESDIHFV